MSGYARPRVVAMILLLALAVAQLYRPKLERPAVRADLAAPPAVKQILVRACYDCHSNETRLQWFDQPAPAYWVVVRDVNRARQRLNFSDFGRLPSYAQRAVLFESLNHVLLDAMPPRGYLALHPSAKLSTSDITIVERYLTSIAPNPSPPSQAAPTVAGEKSGPTLGRAVARAANGIEFPTDYTSWRALSATDRFDNGTLRAVLGNDRALQAVAEGQIQPWPDGAALAKVAWTAELDPTGLIRAGEFKQVEFMFKDRERYAKTMDWGFARWLGADLKPYGQAADFAEECVGCHRPLAKTDFLFTAPFPRAARSSSRARFNEAAAVPGLPFSPLEGRVLAAFADPARKTLSTLYGNTQAAQRAGDAPLGLGSVLALVTWSEVDDPTWFGARIPGPVESVDIATLDPTADGPNWSHQAYAPNAAHGATLERQTPSELAAERFRWLVDQRFASMPNGKP